MSKERGRGLIPLPGSPDQGTTMTPTGGRFTKGRSGNPKGRPRGSGNRSSSGSSLAILLEKTVAAGGNEEAREISMEEALWRRTFKDALAGKRMAMRQVEKWILAREAWQSERTPTQESPATVRRLFSPDPENADSALVILGIATPNPARASPTLQRTPLLLEPWAVKLAMGRMRGRSGLTPCELDFVSLRSRDPARCLHPTAPSTLEKKTGISHRYEE